MAAPKKKQVSKSKAKPKVGEKIKEGRPTKFDVKYVAQVFKMALLGLTDVEMANVLGVTESTFNAWKLKYPDFSESLKDGKENSDGNVAASLYERALGYSHKDVDIKVIDGRIVKTELIKHYPPDTTAAIFWLKNRRKMNWRDKAELGFTDSEGNDQVVIFKLPDNNREKEGKP